MRALPDALAPLTRTAAHRREGGGRKTSKLSSGANDSGMFETNLRDEWFLPFEGAGAISTWTLALPPLRTFDYCIITDVILHIRYTARDGGAALAGPDQFNPPQNNGPSGQALLLCLRYDLPTEWYAFVNNTDGSGDFTATLSKQQFPTSCRTRN